MAERIEPTDPRALRAYAHPIRMSLIGLLRREGPKTATEAAAAIGESVASCSFHLRQLARYGVVEEVGGRHGRAKPWRATAPATAWSSDPDDREMAAAATMLDRAMLDRYHRQVSTWLDHRREQPAEWRRAGQSSDHLLRLTADEAKRLVEQYEALLAPFREREQHPEASRPVHLIHLVLPAVPG
jgi:predicted ArsR family transcriptional regulator